MSLKLGKSARYIYDRPRLTTLIATRSLSCVVPELFSEVDAEPLQRYRPGGYHPVHLHDRIKKGRYQVIHKLGWGGYSTVWLAKDHLCERHVALKISVSEMHDENKEAQNLALLSNSSNSIASAACVPGVLDQFDLVGPNGVHRCLALETLGPSVQAAIDATSAHRLPGSLARSVSKQAAEALAYIHGKGLAHGDFHSGNVVFADPHTSQKSTKEIMQLLGAPLTGNVECRPGFAAGQHVPRYLVWPAALPLPRDTPQQRIKFVDFGSAFPADKKSKIRCPLVFRAPEAVLTSSADLRADIWSLGCTIFELLVGSPPFDNLMPSKVGLVREWIATFGEVPSEWSDFLPPESMTPSDGIDPMSLTEWLLESYYDEGKPVDMSEDDVRLAGDLLETMMRYRPEDRPTAMELLEHLWLKREMRNE